MMYQNRKSQHKAAPFSDLRRKVPFIEKNIYVKKHIKSLYDKKHVKMPAKSYAPENLKKQTEV